MSSTGQQRANLFEGVISPVDPDIVWAAGVDIEESLADPNAGKHIYYSNDGGLISAPILSESADVTIINGPMMAASPTDADVFYFVFGTFFQGFGSDLYRVLPDGNFMKQHNGYDDITAGVPTRRPGNAVSRCDQRRHRLSSRKQRERRSDQC